MRTISDHHGHQIDLPEARWPRKLLGLIALIALIGGGAATCWMWNQTGTRELSAWQSRQILDSNASRAAKNRALQGLFLELRRDIRRIHSYATDSNHPLHAEASRYLKTLRNETGE